MNTKTTTLPEELYTSDEFGGDLLVLASKEECQNLEKEFSEIDPLETFEPEWSTWSLIDSKNAIYYNEMIRTKNGKHYWCVTFGQAAFNVHTEEWNLSIFDSYKKKQGSFSHDSLLLEWLQDYIQSYPDLFITH